MKYFITWRGWSVGRFGQSSSDRTRPTQWAFPFPYSYSSAYSTKLIWAHTHTEGTGRTLLYISSGTFRWAAMRLFSKTCQNAPTFLLPEAHSWTRARHTATSSLSALLYLWSALVQQALGGFGVRAGLGAQAAAPAHDMGRLSEVSCDQQCSGSSAAA